MHLSNIQFPVDFKFHIATIANDFSITDAMGKQICFVREKMFTLRDVIKVYNDSSKSKLLYELRSNKLIDFQQTFTITNYKGETIGKVKRKTLKSFWTATFHIYDENDNHIFTINERSGLTRMLDGFFGEIPIIGALSGYVFNPKYVLKNLNEAELMEITKEPSFWGRKFKLNNISAKPEHYELFILSYMILLIADRERG